MPSGTAMSSAIAEVTSVPYTSTPAPKTLESRTPLERDGFQVVCQRKPRPNFEIDGIDPATTRSMTKAIRATAASEARPGRALSPKRSAMRRSPPPERPICRRSASVAVVSACAMAGQSNMGPRARPWRVTPRSQVVHSRFTTKEQGARSRPPQCDRRGVRFAPVYITSFLGGSFATQPDHQPPRRGSACRACGRGSHRRLRQLFIERNEEGGDRELLGAELGVLDRGADRSRLDAGRANG